MRIYESVKNLLINQHHIASNTGDYRSTHVYKKNYVFIVVI